MTPTEWVIQLVTGEEQGDVPWPWQRLCERCHSEAEGDREGAVVLIRDELLSRYYGKAGFQQVKWRDVATALLVAVFGELPEPRNLSDRQVERGAWEGERGQHVAGRRVGRDHVATHRTQ